MRADISIIQEFIRHLLSATANASLYSPDHPQVAKLVEAAFQSITTVFEATPEVSIASIDGELVINSQPQDYSLFLNRFSDTMKAAGISHLKLAIGLTREEISTLISGLARTKGSSGIATSAHVTPGKIRVGSAAGAGGESEGGVSPGHPPITLDEMPREELVRFMEIYESARNHRKLKVTGMVEIVTGFIDAFRQEGDAMLQLASLRSSDEYTFTHSTNVCILNIAQALSLGIEGQLLRDIGIAALLHDIGKLFVPEELITKKEKLSREEFDIMKRHPALGAKHLLDTPGVPRLAVTTAYEHHMKYNLSGYPAVPADWQPNLCSHLTMISDFFDALRTRRSYREPVELRQIARLMWNMMGTDLHPALTRNFLSILARLVKQEPATSST